MLGDRLYFTFAFHPFPPSPVLNKPTPSPHWVIILLYSSWYLPQYYLKTAGGQSPSAVNRIQGFCCPPAVNSQKILSKNSGWALGSEFESEYPALNCFVFMTIVHLFRFFYVYKELHNFVGIKKPLPSKKSLGSIWGGSSKE